uniref:Transmembrane protein n=1 Tax=Panagrellus redivivus TaxID=6233 RepID=A0A7E4VGY7_PANRE
MGVHHFGDGPFPPFDPKLPSTAAAFLFLMAVCSIWPISLSVAAFATFFSASWVIDPLYQVDLNVPDCRSPNAAYNCDANTLRFHCVTWL